MNARVRFVFTTALVLASIALARPALAGPPLLCHPFDIGTAASLPWSGTRLWLDETQVPNSVLPNGTVVLAAELNANTW